MAILAPHNKEPTFWVHQPTEGAFAELNNQGSLTQRTPHSLLFSCPVSHPARSYSASRHKDQVCTRMEKGLCFSRLGLYDMPKDWPSPLAGDWLCLTAVWKIISRNAEQKVGLGFLGLGFRYLGAAYRFGLGFLGTLGHLLACLGTDACRCGKQYRFCLSKPIK